jgi:hypothetical protein
MKMNEDSLLKAADRAIYESISKQLANDYRGPLKDCVDSILRKHQAKLESIVESAYLGLIDSHSFKEQVDDALMNKLARSLVSKMGGEIESKVNELKSNPETRAQITIAISKLVKQL